MDRGDGKIFAVVGQGGGGHLTGAGVPDEFAFSLGVIHRYVGHRVPAAGDEGKIAVVCHRGGGNGAGCFKRKQGFCAIFQPYSFAPAVIHQHTGRAGGKGGIGKSVLAVSQLFAVGFIQLKRGFSQQGNVTAHRKNLIAVGGRNGYGEAVPRAGGAGKHVLHVLPHSDGDDGVDYNHHRQHRGGKGAKADELFLSAPNDYLKSVFYFFSRLF